MSLEEAWRRAFRRFIRLIPVARDALRRLRHRGTRFAAGCGAKCPYRRSAKAHKKKDHHQG
jgi:hypothetical protein